MQTQDTPYRYDPYRVDEAIRRAHKERSAYVARLFRRLLRHGQLGQQGHGHDGAAPAHG